MCWPSLARSVTTSVTALFGSFVTVAPLGRRRAGRREDLRDFCFGMSAGIVLQTGLLARRTENSANPPAAPSGPMTGVAARNQGHLKVAATFGRRPFGQRSGYRSSEVC